MRRTDPKGLSTSSETTQADDLGGIALFFDVENILLGIQGDLDVSSVVRFLAERGEVMTLRAYADWGRYRRQQRQFLEEGVQMVFLPSYGQTDKNRTDTAICVDAMEILFTRPQIDTFCIVSGDSDFSVLANRLRDHGRRIIGVSAKSAASPILVKQCHEFVFYETLVGQRVVGFSVEEGEARLALAIERVVEEHGTEFHASVLKDRMRKQDSTFSERNYGASSFTRFLANYDHRVAVLDGGVVRIIEHGNDAEDAPAERVAVARQPSLTAKSQAEARSVLMRTMVEAAAQKRGGAVPLSRLKDTMLAVAPSFDEYALGFRTFTQFLLAFPDIVIVDRPTNTARPNEGIVPSLPADVAADAGAVGDRRRKPKKRTEAEAEVDPKSEPKPEAKADAKAEVKDAKAEAKDVKPEAKDAKPEAKTERHERPRDLLLVPTDTPLLAPSKGSSGEDQ